MMASLMSIPQELRDRIIDFVLLDERSPPLDPASTKPSCWRRVKSETTEIRKSWHYGHENVLNEATPVIPNASALMLASRRLHEQTTDAIARLYPNGVKYTLDIMLVNERELWPTWTHVPAFRKHLAGVDVTIRPFGVDTSQERSMFAIGDGSPREIVWCFYSLLQHFLYYGVASPWTSWKQQRPLNRVNHTIKHITLNVVAGESEDLLPEDTKEQQQAWWASHRNRHHNPPSPSERQVSVNEPLRLHPRWLATFIAGELRGLTYLSYHTAEYGRIIHEQIGSINVLSQSEEVSAINPGDVLASRTEGPHLGLLWYNAGTFGRLGGDCRLLSFWNWKYATVKKRRRLGLPVAEPVVWPSLEELRGWRVARDEYRKRSNMSREGLGCDDSLCYCNRFELERMLEEAET